MIIDVEDKEFKYLKSSFDWTNTRVIEIGCGNGRLTKKIARLAKEVVGVDPAIEGSCHIDNYSLIKASAHRLPFEDNSFDAALFSLSLHHIPHDELNKSIDEVIRVCKKGASIVVLEPGFTGTYQILEKEFGLGDGDETSNKQFAQRTITTRKDLGLVSKETFNTFFVFDSISEIEDWFGEELLEECKVFVKEHKTQETYVFDMQRILIVLSV